jgi:Na+-translocating ferredoxin:NAD+ oxidoreductase RnfE subunit
MITTKVKRKITITKVVVSKLERFKPFEIRIPANVTKITGILVTVSAK